MKEGDKGATFYRQDGGEEVHVDAFNLQDYSDLSLVDTTGAGDTFTGAFAASLSLLDQPRSVSNEEIRKSISFANMAGLLCISKFGAGPSIPRLEEVEKRLREL